jgi:molybdopterin-containing oxidoreductase family iron-sulfur binding subunit
MNRALDSAGQTVIYTDPIEARPEDQIASLGQLVEDMDRGLVEALVILGGNPVYTAPADFRFGERLLALSSDGKPNVPLRIHLSLYVDETSAHCDWHLPEAHYLESWSDARAYDGTASIVQPLIAPLYGGKSGHEVLAAVLGSKAGEAQRSGYELVRSHWRGVWEGGHRNRSGQTERDRTADGRRWTQTSQGSPEREDEFARFWRAALHDGAVAGTAFAPKKVALRKDLVKELAAGGRAGASAGALRVAGERPVRVRRRNLRPHPKSRHCSTDGLSRTPAKRRSSTRR